jgi:probable F420-dependent oxidoreductase
MKIGISTPVLFQVPSRASAWERTARVEDLVALARTADEVGIDYLICAEHVAVPEEAAAVRGGTYWDPLATLAFLGAHTQRIQLVTAVLVLGYHRPEAIAKRYGTLDLLTGGRVVLGVGVGSLKEEFDMLGVAWEDRGARADADLRRLREVWGQTSVDGMRFEPTSPRSTVPVWVGGRTPRSLRRAVELGSGWMPFGLGGDEMAAMLARFDLPEDFEVVLSPSGSLDPLGDPERARSRLRAVRAIGATRATCTVDAESAAHYCEQLAALADLAVDLGD